MNYDQVITRMLTEGRSATNIQERLGISRNGYYDRLERLADCGSISRPGDLPSGATTEVYPTTEALAVFADSANASGMASETVSKATTLATRYGMMDPPTSDRYNRSQWMGQAFRRVDYPMARNISIMVVGSIVPRIDRKPWERAVPTYRTVYVAGSGSVEFHCTWPAQRGRFVDINAVESNFNLDDGAFFTSGGLVDLTVAVAWVCESRAILVREV